ncbi:MAG: DUF4340 domain-containing protein [Candidatus Aminicenantes bacterium]|nr:MAG: DUF4340 domain-containing protein [Candidatus Aminicenantes bacterium]
MRFKSTLILLSIFILLFVAVYFFEFRNQGEKNTDDMLVSIDSEDVEKMIFRDLGQTIQFQREEEEWLITNPIKARADKYEVNRMADDFSSLRIERVVEAEPSDLEKYGIPQREIELFIKGQDSPLNILIGMENPLDNTFFAKRADETKVVLIPSSLKTLLEKKVFDFRQKDIFKFDSDQAKSVKLRAQEVQWEAEKVEDDWFLRKPVNALAQNSKINDILNALSNLKASAFVSEQKQEEEIKDYGLDKPDYEVMITFPVENREVHFFIHEKDDKVHATSSVSSKILQVEDPILSDLKKEPSDLRDKEVANFFTWEVKKLQINKGLTTLILTKDEEENWHFEKPELQEANKEKIQSFLRKLEALESEEFVDPPLNLVDIGLDVPQAEIKIWTGGEEETPEEVIILIGAEDKDSKKLFVKNDRFQYVFKVDSAFLEEFPEQAENWKSTPETEKIEEKD